MQTEQSSNLLFWLAMVSSIAMYGFVMRLLPPAVRTDNPGLVSVLIVVAFALAAASFLVKSRLPSPRVGLIVAVVLCEAAALVGVVGWFVTGSPQSYYPLLIGFIGALMHYPGER